MKKVIFLLLASLTIHSTYGCVCDGSNESIEGAFFHSQLVLKGIAISHRLVGINDTVYNKDSTQFVVQFDPNAIWEYTFIVDKVYKGYLDQDTILLVTRAYSSCTVSLPMNTEYFVFTNVVFDLSFCSGNRPFTISDEKKIIKSE